MKFGESATEKAERLARCMNVLKKVHNSSSGFVPLQGIDQDPRTLHF